jgi:hypothetical protein
MILLKEDEINDEDMKGRGLIKRIGNIHMA